MAAPVGKEEDRRSVLRFWRLGVFVALLALAGSGVGRLLRRPPAPSRGALLPGYIGNFATVQQEYARFYGKLLKDPDVEQQFHAAAAAVLQRNYAGAADLFEATSKRAAVPAVFNDLGVLYAQLNDRSHAIGAFREALARDIDYQPVRLNLQRLKGFTADSADPVTREIEPNGSNLLANVIAAGAPVDGEIAAETNDMDCYRFTSPPAPRDILAIEIANRSRTLMPALSLYDSEMRVLDWSKEAPGPGASLERYFSPEPNTTFYLDISGGRSTSGAYVLTVKPLKAFDDREPNDDILTASRIRMGEIVEANIMDGRDTDYYSFIGPRTGTVTVNIRNRSTDLIPALSTFTPEMRSSGFGPDIRTPGESLQHTIAVQQGLVYYIQVWPQANSSGAYSLSVE